MRKLLMATDLSARSDRALQRAIALADQLGAALQIVHVIDDSIPETIVAQYENAAHEMTKKLLSTMPAAINVSPNVKIVRGHGYAEIIHRAVEFGAEMIILGVTRYTQNELFRGTTAERVIRMGALPVLLVRDPVARNYGKVLVATDNSPAARSALENAIAIAPGAEIHLLHAIHVPFRGLLGSQSQEEVRQLQEDRFRRKLEEEINTHATALGGGGLTYTIHLEKGEIINVLNQQITQLKPNLLALGMHGRPTLRHALIGSIAAEMLSHPPVDVLVAKAW